MRFLGEMLSEAFNQIGSGNAELLATTWRTLELALISTAIALLVGLPLGLLLGERATRWPRRGLVLANAGLGIPPVALGIYVAFLLLPGWPLGGLRWTYTLPALIIAQTLLAFPLVVALTASAVRGLPAGLLDQARAFGASWWHRGVFALREARVGVLTAIIAALGSAVAEVGAVVIVGGNVRGRTNTLASTILLDISASNPAGATADLIVLVALVLVLGGILTFVQQRERGRHRLAVART